VGVVFAGKLIPEHAAPAEGDVGAAGYVEGGARYQIGRIAAIVRFT